jgi:hypothetical protein
VQRGDARLKSFDGIAQKQERRKAIQSLRRRRFQTGCVRLRKGRSPAYWVGLYREDVVTEAGKTERKRRYVNLGLLKDVPSEKAARQKLALILEPINNFSQSSKMRITFREFIEKYRSLKLAIKKETTARGYETNIRAHFLPRFGEVQLSQISIETVQEFLNAKNAEGKSVQTIKNLKWGLSSIFVAAMKYGNPFFPRCRDRSSSTSARPSCRFPSPEKSSAAKSFRYPKDRQGSQAKGSSLNATGTGLCSDSKSALQEQGRDSAPGPPVKTIDSLDSSQQPCFSRPGCSFRRRGT